MLATDKGQADVCEMLLSRKANVNHTDKLNNRTALMYGCSSSYTSDELEGTAVEVLLQGRADVNLRTQDARTPLMLAANAGYKDICCLLLEYKADVNAQASTAEVDHKAMHMHHKVVSTFFKGENSTSLKDFMSHTRKREYEEDIFAMSEPETPLMNVEPDTLYGSWHGEVGEQPLSPAYVISEETSQKLQDMGKLQEDSIETTATDGFMEEPELQEPRLSGRLSLQEALSEGSEYEREATGFTPPPHLFLSKVAALRKRDMCPPPKSEEELEKIQKQSERLRLLQRDHGGTFDTALTLAARQGHVRICQLLLVYGADINAKDKSGEAAVEIAAREGHHEVCKVLAGGNLAEGIHENALRLARAHGNEGATAALRGYEVLAA